MKYILIITLSSLVGVNLAHADCQILNQYLKNAELEINNATPISDFAYRITMAMSDTNPEKGNWATSGFQLMRVISMVKTGIINAKFDVDQKDEVKCKEALLGLMDKVTALNESTIPLLEKINKVVAAAKAAPAAKSN